MLLWRCIRVACCCCGAPVEVCAIRAVSTKLEGVGLPHVAAFQHTNVKANVEHEHTGGLLPAHVPLAVGGAILWANALPSANWRMALVLA